MKQKLGKLLKALTNLFLKLTKRNFKKLLPVTYIFFVAFGLVLTGIHYAFFPRLAICSSFFGESFCTPAGIFIAIIASLPGYLIAGNILKFTTELPGYVSFVLVFLTSYGFYYLLGLVIERQKGKPLTLSGITKVTILLVFIFLVLLVLSLI